MLLPLLMWGSGLAAQSAVLTNPSACRLQLPIRDFSCSDETNSYNPDRFAIDVTDAPGTTLGVDVFLSEVRLIIRHTWVADVDVVLRSPGGQTVLLTADNGGGDDNYGLPDLDPCTNYVRFAAGSCRSIREGQAPFLDGPYQPQESFLAFNDERTNPNGRWTLEVCDDAQEDTGTLEFVQLVFEPIQCLPIEAVQVTDIDTTTVNLHWEPATACGVTVIEYGPPGFRPGSGLSAGEGTAVTYDGCPPYRLRGLAPETTYDIYVRRRCGTGNFSANACPVTARTGCLPPPPTIIETFDGAVICPAACGAACPLEGPWRNSTLDDVDWIAYEGATPTQGTGPAAGVRGGGRYLYLEATESASCRPGAVARLVSNCIRFDRRGSDTCHLSFNYHMYGPAIGTLRLEVSTDGGFSWSPLWERRGDQGNRWHKIYLAVEGVPDGAVAQFRFTGVKGDGARGDMALDEIVFYGSEDLGPAPNRFYLDADADGYGDPARFLGSCATTPPPGYVAVAGDCDDTDPAVNPGRPEAPCDGIDNNCNGEADDFILPPPLPRHDTICSGETPLVCATPQSGRFILWYGSPAGDDFLGVFDECYAPVLPENNSPAPVVYRFYAEETDLICRSDQRAEVVVVVNPRPDISVAAEPAVCPGQPFDLAGVSFADAHFTGATFTFHSASPATPANELPGTVVTPAASTTYSFLAASPSGCVDEGSLTLRVKAGPGLTFSPADSFALCREGVQRVAVQPAGGANPYRFRWSTGATSDAIDIRAASQTGRTDTYRLTVTDSEGCFTTDSVRVTTTASIEAVRRSIEDVTTCSGRDGSITVTPLSGQAPFRFQWEGTSGVSGDSSGVDAALRIAGLPQGAYRITITDSSPGGCSFLMRSVLVNGPNAVIDEPTVTPVTCAGAADGEICLNVSGANPRFRWSSGDTTRCLPAVAGGAYSVTVTDGPCENVLPDIVVAEPPPLSLSAELTAPSCADAADGRLRLTAFGGQGAYSYRWSTGAAGPELVALPGGSYQLTLTDGNGCTLLDTFDLPAPPPLAVTVDAQRDMSCAGVPDGFLRVTGAGGVAPYRYRWNTGSTAPVLSGLSAGRYAVTVTDFQGCQQVRQFDIREPAPLTAAIAEQVQPLCDGDFTGRLRAEVAGGTPEYVYYWSANGEDSVLTGLGVGAYTLVVEDANGCRTDTLRAVLAPRSVLDLRAAITPPVCVGANDGAIVLQPLGQGPFRYLWERGDTTAELTAAEAGAYAVTIVDGQGCRYDTTLQVTAPQAFQIDFGVRAPSCSGGGDGVINPVLLAGGVPPLAYRWSDGSTASSLFGIGDGDYVLTLTDSRGCRFVSDTLTIASPAPLEVTVAELGPINCKGDSTGYIELDVRGGVAPYTYNWLGLNPQPGAAAYDLPAGQYRVQVLDANNCPADAVATLSEPPALQLSVNVETSDPCRGNGQILVSARASGGIGPYEYHWSTGARDTLLTGLAPGDYALTVEDGNSCVVTAPAVKVREAFQPLRLDTFAVADISCFGARDGQMTARVSGGARPARFRFHFSNNEIVVTSANAVTRTGLPRSNGYSVTVTDLNTGCVVVSSRLPLSEPALLSSRLDSLRQISCFAGIDGAVYVTTLGGVTPYTYTWFDAAGRQVGSQEDLRNVGAGTYGGIVTDARGCIDTLPAVELVSLNPELRRIDSLTIVQNARCRGGRSGAISISLNGGTPPYRYQWSNGAVTKDLDSIPAGSYSLTVTDARNCRALLPPLVVSEPLTAITASGSGINPGCFGGRDGRVQANVQGGMPPYALTWLRGADTIAAGVLRLDSLGAGLYVLQVRDLAGCVRTFPFDVAQPDSLDVRIEVTPPGQAMAVVRGGAPRYEYLWSTGERTATIDTLRPGNLSVTVTDLNGCTASAATVITSTYQSEVVRTVRLFPNPNRGRFSLELVLARPIDLWLEVADAAGRRLERRRLDRAYRESLAFDGSTWPAGTYWLVLHAEGKVVYSGKILVE